MTDSDLSFCDGSSHKHSNVKISNTDASARSDVSEFSFAKSRSSVTAITIAALVAVALWSLKPIFISLVGDRGGFAEVYVVSAAISVLASFVIALVCHRWTRMLLHGGRPAMLAVRDSVISGLFLALWYYGFYRALYGTSKADATIIAFTWPLITVMAIRVFSPSTAPKMRWYQWVLILVSFAGAAAIGIANIGGSHSSSGNSHAIIYAFVAAIGSGLYLPFAINASNRFGSIIGSQPGSTFYAVSIANVVSLVGILLSLQLTNHPMNFEGFNASVIFICCLIGVGTYIVAEVAWTWAFQAYKSLTLSSLPYFSPAVSVVLLYLFFHEPVSVLAVMGLLLILFSNITLHVLTHLGSRRSLKRKTHSRSSGTIV